MDIFLSYYIIREANVTWDQFSTFISNIRYKKILREHSKCILFTRDMREGIVICSKNISI